MRFKGLLFTPFTILQLLHIENDILTNDIDF